MRDPLASGTGEAHAPSKGVVALSGFFALGAVIATVTCIALLFPGGRLEPMWRLNPEAHVTFLSMGPWAVALMCAVAAVCPCQHWVFGFARGGGIDSRWRSSPSTWLAIR